MESISSLLKISLPIYFRNLPIPNYFGGFAKLSGSDWLALLPFVGTLSFLVYVTVLAFKPKSKPEDTAINMKIQKESDKVVHVVDIEDLGKKTVYCRCWRSKKFPLCDGSHTKHNMDTGDNVGPLVLRRMDVSEQ